jgi:hypothetical protein
MGESVKIVVGLCLLLLASSGFAESAESGVAAKQHFDEGTKAFNLGEFPRAVLEYKAAYNAKPDAVFLYNIAQSYRLSGDLQNALFFYKSYLRNTPNASNKREVESRIRTLETQLAQSRAIATAPPNSPAPPTSEAPPAPPVAQQPAPPVVETSPPVDQPVVTPPPAELPPSTSSTTLVARAPEHADRVPVYKKWWLWTAVGVVVVGAGLGVGLGLGLSHNSAPSSHLGTTPVSF